MFIILCVESTVFFLRIIMCLCRSNIRLFSTNKLFLVHILLCLLLYVWKALFSLYVLYHVSLQIEYYIFFNKLIVLFCVCIFYCIIIYYSVYEKHGMFYNLHVLSWNAHLINTLLIIIQTFCFKIVVRFLNISRKYYTFCCNYKLTAVNTNRTIIYISSIFIMSIKPW